MGYELEESTPDHSSLSVIRTRLGAEVFQAALDVGAADHHLRVLQFPYGLAMGEGAGLASQLGPDGVTHAILDRLVHNAYRINLKGESMRKRNAKLTETTPSE